MMVKIIWDIHLALIRDTIKVLGMSTMHECSKTGMDYAPFCLVHKDPRFRVGNQRFVVTSVHLPPTNRQKAQQKQLDSFIVSSTVWGLEGEDGYGGWFRSTASLPKNQLPLTDKVAKEYGCPPITHMILGDFNVWPGRKVE